METDPEAPSAKAFMAISTTATPTDRRVMRRVARWASSSEAGAGAGVVIVGFFSRNRG